MWRVFVRLVGAGLVGLTALAACSTTPPEQDPVLIKLHDLDVRLARIERVMANQSLLELSNQLEALRSDVRGMHNDVDLLTNSLESSRKQQRDLYADLDKRLKALETHGAVPATPGATAANLPAPNSVLGVSAPALDAGVDGDDKAAYQAAFSFLKQGQYDRAVPALQRFLASYPESPLAENALYWLGEANYVNKVYSDASVAFQRVIDQYPQSRKIPDALLKIGYCRYEMQQWEASKLALSRVITQFPDNPDAKLAQQRIDKMAVEKH